MSDHTPGPWTISDHYEDDNHVLGPDGFPVAVVEATAVMPGYSEKLGVDHWAGHKGTAYIERPVGEVAANARLVVAAPKMLEFIESILSPYDMYADAETLIARYEEAARAILREIGG